jgi:hypothetical protein
VSKENVFKKLICDSELCLLRAEREQPPDRWDGVAETAKKYERAASPPMLFVGVDYLEMQLQ